MHDPVEPSARPVIRFGTFEVDVAAGELRRQGVKTRLQEQPLKVLLLLLSRPGEVVTREELRAQLWPADTFVDFEHGLNAAVKRLRDALGDSADNPRFIETLPRRGYRFLPPVDDSSPASSRRPCRRRKRGSPSRDGRPRRPVIGCASWPCAGRGSGGRDGGADAPAAAPGPVLTRLTSDTGLATDPAVSPDGSLLAYASDRSGEGNLDIWVQQLSGGAALRLTRHDAEDHEPAFSPDGTRIVFRSERDGGGIYVVSALGGEERIIAPPGPSPPVLAEGRRHRVLDGLAASAVTAADGCRPPSGTSGMYVVARDRGATSAIATRVRDRSLPRLGPRRGKESSSWECATRATHTEDAIRLVDHAPGRRGTRRDRDPRRPPESRPVRL